MKIFFNVAFMLLAFCIPLIGDGTDPITFGLTSLTNQLDINPKDPTAVLILLPDGYHRKNTYHLINSYLQKGFKHAYVYFNPRKCLTELKDKHHLLRDLHVPYPKSHEIQVTFIEWPYDAKKEAFNTALEHVQNIVSNDCSSIYAWSASKKIKNKIIKVSPRQLQWDCCVTAEFKGETQWIKEWIEYYLLLGVDHFFLYDNWNNDDYFTVLEPYIRKGVVTLFSWDGVPFHYFQILSQNYAIDICKYRSRWLALFDLDEFFVPYIENQMYDFLKQFEEFGGVRVNWKIFGTSWQDEVLPGNTMIETLLLRGDDIDPSHAVTKTILQPHLAEFMHHQHRAQYIDGYFDVFTDKSPADARDLHCFKGAQLNHYFTRTQKHFIEVKYPRKRGFYSLPPTYIDDTLNRYNRVEDDKIIRFIPLLRQQLGLE